jgi:serpin B
MKVLLAAAAFAGLIASALPPQHALAQVSPASARDSALTDALNASARELLGQLAKSPGNIVLSPYSIGSAMSMTLLGARGAAEQEMRLALQL